MNEDFDYRFKRVISVCFFTILLILLVVSSSLRGIIWKIIKPVAAAFALAYFLDPLVRFFCKKFKISRGKSMLMVIIIIICIIIFMGTIIIPGIMDSFSNINRILTKNISSDSLNFINKDFHNEIINKIMEYVSNSLDGIISKITLITTIFIENILQGVIFLGSTIVNFLLAFVMAIYMLMSKEDLKARIKRMIFAFLNQDRAESVMYTANLANDIFSGFFVGKIIDSLIIGILAWIVMMIAQIPNAMVFGLIIGLTNMIPYFGPFIGAVPCVLITLFISPYKALAVIIIIVVLQQLDGLVIGPKILGNKVGVGAFWIIVAVTIGGAAAGVVGMLLGVPVVVLIKTIIENKVTEKLEEKKMKDYCLDKLKD